MNGVKNLKVNTTKINAIMATKIGFGTLVGLSAFMMPAVLGSVLMGGIGVAIIGQSIISAKIKKSDAMHILTLKEEEKQKLEETKKQALAAASARNIATPPVARFRSSQYNSSNQANNPEQEEQRRLQEEQQKLQKQLQREIERQAARDAIFGKYANNEEGTPFMSSADYQSMQEEMKKIR